MSWFSFAMKKPAGDFDVPVKAHAGRWRIEVEEIVGCRGRRGGLMAIFFAMDSGSCHGFAIRGGKARVKSFSPSERFGL